MCIHTHIKENCTYFKGISVYKIWIISQHVEIGGGHIGLARSRERAWRQHRHIIWHKTSIKDIAKVNGSLQALFILKYLKIETV